MTLTSAGVTARSWSWATTGSTAPALRHTLNYVVDTYELYFMAAPDPEVIEDAFGDIAVDDDAVEELTVEVIAVVPGVDELHAALSGWEDVVGQVDSANWVRGRVAGFAASWGLPARRSVASPAMPRAAHRGATRHEP